MYHYPESNMSNAVVAFFSGLPAYFTAVTEQSMAATFFAAFLPFFFFLLGKGIDVLIRLYMDRRQERRGPRQ